MVLSFHKSRMPQWSGRWLSYENKLAPGLLSIKISLVQIMVFWLRQSSCTPSTPQLHLILYTCLYTDVIYMNYSTVLLIMFQNLFMRPRPYHWPPRFLVRVSPASHALFQTAAFGFGCRYGACPRSADKWRGNGSLMAYTRHSSSPCSLKKIIPAKPAPNINASKNNAGTFCVIAITIQELS